MKQLMLLEAATPKELYEKVQEVGGEMLSMKELMKVRTQTATEAAAELFASGIEEPDLPLCLSQALRDYLVWNERLTTNTHMIRIQGGYQFVECGTNGLDFKDIIDGGVRYPFMEGGRFLNEDTYNAHPGGTYPVSQWARHPVLRKAVGSDHVLNAYSTIVYSLSNARFNSPGKESIWCPQALEQGTGRAWALGMGADAAYPPNNTTRGHWTVLRK